MKLLNRISVFALSLGLFACSSTSVLSDKDAIDYRSSTISNKLEIPPDLTQLKPNERFILPSAVPGAKPVSAASNEVLPVDTKTRIERAGTDRWLWVDMPAEKVYPIVLEFWKQSGFNIAVENPATGVVETDWAENRAKVPLDGIRKVLGGIFDNLYDSGERDKFKTRLERSGQATEIYISHRGTKEESVQKDVKEYDVITKTRNGDPALESEFLKRLMVRFGATPEAAKAAVGNSVAVKDRATIKDDMLIVDDAVEIAWRRLGIALDRTGFTIEDRNYSEGIYYVKYSRVLKEEELSAWNRIFSSERKKLEAPHQLRIVLNKTSNPVSISVQSEKPNTPVPKDITQSILKVLHSELR